jgi:hypothetical protein
MRYNKFKETMSIRLDSDTRAVIEQIATNERLSMCEVAREFLKEGMKARGLMA